MVITTNVSLWFWGGWGEGGGGDGEASCGKPISCVVFSQSKSCVLGRAREAYLVYEQRALTLYVRGGRGAEGGAP